MIIGWALDALPNVSQERQREISHTHTQERQVKTEAGVGETRNSSKHQKLRVQGALPQRASRGRTVLRPGSDFWPPELRESISMVLSHPVCGNLQPEETNTSSHAVALSMQDKIC